MAVEIEVAYAGKLLCQATHGPSRVQISTEAPKDNGGRGLSFSPTDLLATALGSCMLTVMGLEAAKEGLDLEGTQARVLKEMTAQPRRRVAVLRVRIEVHSASALTAAQKHRLEEAARHCPVAESLSSQLEQSLTFHYPG